MLEARNLHCERDDRVLFRELGFSVAPGQALQVQGSNGSGKTTLLRILCGLNADYSGEILWKGQPAAKVRTDLRENIFYLGHMPAINRTLTATENLRWFCALHGRGDGGGIPAALAGFGLRGYDDMPCYLLSAGQQRRVSLARMQLTQAVFWILDEPFTALDRNGVEELEAMLTAFVKDGGALILTTHHALRLDCPVAVIDLDGPQTGTERQ